MFLLILGLVSLSLWTLILFITHGLPADLVQALPSIIQPAFTNAQNGFYYDLPNREMPTGAFLLIFLLLFVLYFIACRYVQKHHPKNYLSVIIICAICFRLVSLPGVLIHENDIYRYLWDGKVFKHKINPYKYAPAVLESLESRYRVDVYDLDKKAVVPAGSFDAQDQREIKILKKLRRENLVYFSRIGHRWVSTIYPPVLELFFLLVALIQEDSILLMKGLFVLFDLMCIFVIIYLLKARQKPPSMVIIYAWSPLIIKEFANSGHADAIPIFFMLLFVAFVLSQKKIWATRALAAAGLSKFFPFMILPLTWLRWDKRYTLGSLLIALIYFIPFFIWQGTGIKQVFHGLMVYSRMWMYNGSLFALFYHFLKGLPHGLMISKALCGLILLGVIAWRAFQKRPFSETVIQDFFIILVVLFLVNPVGDPWYYTWIIPFLCFFPWRSLIILSGLLVFSYMSFNPGWHLTLIKNESGMPWLLLIQYVPFYMLFSIDLLKKRRAVHV